MKLKVFKRYEFITRHFLPRTFLKSYHQNADYTRFDGHIATDYNWVETTADTDAGVRQTLAKIRADFPETDYTPAWLLSSVFGGDYDAPYAGRANQLMGPKDPRTDHINPAHHAYDTWNELWLGQALTGANGLGSFHFDQDKLRTAKSQFNIYPATPADVAHLATAYQQTINAGVYQDPGTGEAELRPIMQKILGAGDDHVAVTTLLATSQAGELAGFLIGGTDGEFAYINDIGVLPKFRRRGLGHLLTATFAHHAKKLGAAQLDLDTMEPDNIRLYERMGFTRWGLIIQGQPKFTDNDCKNLEKPL